MSQPRFLSQSGAAIALAGLLLAGCVGIGHVRVSVPEVQLSVTGTGRPVTLDLVCADFYGESDGYIALVSRSLQTGSQNYDWKRLNTEASVALTSCRSEERYIGFPAMPFIPLAPSDKTARSRAIFVHVAGERVMYRVSIHGTSTTVEVTSLDEAEKQFPAQLNEPEPPSLSPQWSQRIQLRSDYYSAVKWHSSKRLRVGRIDSNDSGAISFISVEVTSDN